MAKGATARLKWSKELLCVRVNSDSCLQEAGNGTDPDCRRRPNVTQSVSCVKEVRARSRDNLRGQRGALGANAAARRAPAGHLGPDDARDGRSRSLSTHPHYRNGPATVHLILTARREKEDVVEGLASGANDYLAKPYTTGELQARVEEGRRTLELQAHLARKVRELQEALEHVKTLQGILPICCFCKRIRDDQDYWRQVEDYVTSRSEARFSHSVCPECMKREYPRYAKDSRGDAS